MSRPLAFALAIARPLAWLALFGVTTAMSLEILLQYRVAIKLAYEPPTRMTQLDRSYEPFVVQHLHPQYFFFFPLDPSGRTALANAVCSIDRDGFREPGPAHANGRKLAVVLGGSALFGHYASSNDATITSQLNRLQDEYFFVNAGVPSWNSTQQVLRLMFQIAEMKPALVIAYDGTNDAAQSGMFSPRTGMIYPPGTPESFDDLERWVDDIRSERWQIRMPRLFPEIRHRVEKYRDEAEDAEEYPPTPDEDVAGAVRHYLANQQRMASMVRAAGGRFISVFQPMAMLHRHVPESWRDSSAQEVTFHRLVAGATHDYEFHDLATVFDQHFTEIPVAEGEVITDQTIFVDDVHLFDPGNAIAARHLLEIVRTPQRR